MPVNIFAGLMGLLFGLSAILQYNDPDPVVWATFYGVSAVTCFAYAAKKPVAPLAMTVFAIAVVWSLYLLPGVMGKVAFSDLAASMKASRPEIEEAREGLGLLIIAGTMAVLLWLRKTPSPKPES